MDDVIVVNEKDEVVGMMPKSEAHKDSTPHRIAVTYVENPQGEILVQARADDFLDHSSAGHVHPGESYEEAAKRELAEELGISGVELRRVGHGVTKDEIYPDQIVSHVFDIFACVAEPKELQEDEVGGVYWAKAEDVLQDMQDEKNKSKYCGGFIVSLLIYLEEKKNKI